MKLLDILLLVFLVWGGYRGFRKGLIGEIFHIGALILAILGSTRLLDSVVVLCAPWFHGQEELLPYIVFVCLFLAILVVITMSGRLLRALIKPTVLGNLDRLLGCILGILKWSVCSSTLLWLGNLLELRIPATYTENTFIFPIIESLSPQLLSLYWSWVANIQA